MSIRVCLTCVLLMVMLPVGTRAVADDETSASTQASAASAPVDRYVALKDNPDADKKLLELCGSGFRLEKTDHYVIASDADAATIKSFVYRLEATYKSALRFTEKTGVEVTVPPGKLQILFFDSLESYVRYARGFGVPAGEGIPGFYDQISNRSAFFNFSNAPSFQRELDRIQQMRDEIRPGQASNEQLVIRLQAGEKQLDMIQERVNRTIVQHEVAHQVFWNVGLHVKGQANPRWFTEGLAMMFETPSGRGGAGLGAVNQDRLRDWLDLEKNNRLMDHRRLVGEPSVILPSSPEINAAYAQSWGLMHYIQRSKRKQLVKYIGLIKARKENRVYTSQEEIATFEEAFGALDERFNDRLRKSIKVLPIRSE